MKNIVLSFLMATLFLTVSAALAAELDMPHITVNGTATIQVTPNQMIWMLTVRNTDLKSMGAAKANETSVAAVLAFLKQNQIADSKTQTSRMQLGENWKYMRGENIQDGYFSSTGIQFTLDDLTRYAPIWTGLSGIAGVQVNNVSLDHSDRIKFQNEARTRAVLAARDKAKVIAETLGLQLGQPMVVEEDIAAVEGYHAQMPSSASIFSNEVRTVSAPIDAGDSVAPGSIAIRSRIKAVFQMVKK
jgi:uncharacterized protein